MTLHSLRWANKRLRQSQDTYPTSAQASVTYATSAAVATMPTSAQIAGVYVASAFCVPRFPTSAYCNVTFVKSS